MHWTERDPDFACVPEDAILASLPFPLPVLLRLKDLGMTTVLFDNSVRQAIKAQLGMLNVEMGGLLIGQVARRRNGGYLVKISNHAAAQEFDSSSVSLAMSPSVWDIARREVRDFHFVIGWYHSHPNLGAFFSGTDRATQRHFFRETYNIGLVVDPIREEEAWFFGAEALALPPTGILGY